MSLNGKLTRVRELLGNLTDRGPKLSGKIGPVNRLQGTLRSGPRFSGVLTVVGKQITVTIRRITQIYRFIRAICTERLHIRVRPVGAKGAMSAAHKRIDVVRGTRPVSGPAILPTVRWAERIRRSVNPVSRFVGNVYAHIAAVVGHAVDPIAAPGATSSPHKSVQAGQAVTPIPAPGAAASPSKGVQAVRDVAPIPAPGAIAAQHRSAQTAQDVAPIPAPGAPAATRRALRLIRNAFAEMRAALTASAKTRRIDVTGKAGASAGQAELSKVHAAISATDKAKPVPASATHTAAQVSAWCVRKANAASRYIGNLFARRAAVMGKHLTASTGTGDALWLHRASQTARIASAARAAVELTRISRAARMGINATLEEAAVATADPLTAVTRMASTAFATTYATSSANALQIITTASDLLPGTAPATTAAAHSVQIVRDRASAGNWYAPDFYGSTLTVYQMSGGVQTANVLELDIECGAYWANAFCADDVLTLVFAADAEQNNNILEVF